MQNFSLENEFDLNKNELVGKTHYHKNNFTLRLVLTQRQTRTRKWAKRLVLILSNFVLRIILYMFSLVSSVSALRR